MHPILWDDGYNSRRWTYGLTYRPLHPAHVPAGFIYGSQRRDPGYPHGTVDYPRELAGDEVSGYQLTLVKACWTP